MNDKPKTVDDIVALWLSANGYDGLVEEDGECGCQLSDLAPCGEMRATCIAGYKGPDHSGEFDFMIFRTRADAEKGRRDDD